MTDFFVSYNQADRGTAEWIAYALEEAGYEVIIQAWDFTAGSNFVLEMQKAAARSRRTIAVVSQAYLDAEFTHPEWAAAFARDPTGQDRALLPVLVECCSLDGILAQVVYVSIYGLKEQEARARLLDAVKGNRMKPATPPEFPSHVAFREVVETASPRADERSRFNRAVDEWRQGTLELFTSQERLTAHAAQPLKDADHLQRSQPGDLEAFREMASSVGPDLTEFASGVGRTVPVVHAAWETVSQGIELALERLEEGTPDNAAFARLLGIMAEIERFYEDQITMLRGLSEATSQLSHIGVPALTEASTKAADAMASWIGELRAQATSIDRLIQTVGSHDLDVSEH